MIYLIIKTRNDWLTFHGPKDRNGTIDALCLAAPGQQTNQYRLIDVH